MRRQRRRRGDGGGGAAAAAVAHRERVGEHGLEVGSTDALGKPVQMQCVHAFPWRSYHIAVQGKTGLALGKQVNGPTQAYASLVVNCRNFIIM